MCIGGLGSYGIQYAKLLAPNSNTVAIDISDSKLEVAAQLGAADYTINLRKCQDLKSEIDRITEGNGVSAAIDCVGTEETSRDFARMLSKGGVLVIVGLFGPEIEIPLVPAVINEYQVQCSLWGNYNSSLLVTLHWPLVQYRHSNRRGEQRETESMCLYFDFMQGGIKDAYRTRAEFFLLRVRSQQRQLVLR